MTITIIYLVYIELFWFYQEGTDNYNYFISRFCGKRKKKIVRINLYCPPRVLQYFERGV